ncbi:hypothetical protein [Prochlorococcus marinus]|nr:hypothetical protein [Prochlorococcus marinus]
MTRFLQLIQHPVEGCAYLVYAGFFFRWRFPKSWNKLMEVMTVKDLPTAK